jgi:hypothetical protein
MVKAYVPIIAVLVVLTVRVWVDASKTNVGANALPLSNVKT